MSEERPARRPPRRKSAGPLPLLLGGALLVAAVAIAYALGRATKAEPAPTPPAANTPPAAAAPAGGDPFADVAPQEETGGATEAIARDPKLWSANPDWARAVDLAAEAEVARVEAKRLHDAGELSWREFADEAIAKYQEAVSISAPIEEQMRAERGDDWRTRQLSYLRIEWGNVVSGLRTRGFR